MQGCVFKQWARSADSCTGRRVTKPYPETDMNPGDTHYYWTTRVQSDYKRCAGSYVSVTYLSLHSTALFILKIISDDVYTSCRWPLSVRVRVERSINSAGFSLWDYRPYFPSRYKNNVVVNIPKHCKMFFPTLIFAHILIPIEDSLIVMWLFHLKHM